MGPNRSSDSLSALLEASGLGQSGSVAHQLTSIGEQLANLRAMNETMSTQAAAFVAQSPAIASGGRAGAIQDAGGNISSAGLGLSPLVAGLADLFSGGGVSSPFSEMPFVRPLPIHGEGGFSDTAGGATFALDRAVGGSPRAMTAGTAAQVTVQVQAMDSQSFLDHSHEIAMAVRQAMLETTVLNDVIREV
jgi:hypothetical protein